MDPLLSIVIFFFFAFREIFFIYSCVRAFSLFPIKAGYTPLHVAAHFGQAAMVRFLLSNGASVDSSTSAGYTPLHQAAQQGHTLVINLLLEGKAQPNATTHVSLSAVTFFIFFSIGLMRYGEFSDRSLLWNFLLLFFLFSCNTSF